jgi:hypothetical protein
MSQEYVKTLGVGRTYRLVLIASRQNTVRAASFKRPFGAGQSEAPQPWPIRLERAAGGVGANFALSAHDAMRCKSRSCRKANAGSIQ